MINLEYTYRIQKNLLTPVLEQRKPNQAGVFNLKLTIREGFAGFELLNIWGGQPSLVSREAKVSPTLFEVCKTRRINDRVLGIRDSRTNIQSLELVAGETVQTEVKAHDKCCEPSLFRKITNKNIKGRVERDCLNVSQNKTNGGCNVHSAKARLLAPTSEDISYVLRVIKETGIEKSVDAQSTKDALESYCLSSKLTLKSDLLHLFTPFQL